MNILSPILLLNGVIATGASANIIRVVGINQDIQFVVQSYFTTVGAGSITVLTIDGEGSLDTDYWFALGSHDYTATELTNKAAIFHIVNKPVNYFRLNVSTLTSSGTIAIYGKVNYTGRAVSIGG